ncbi:MAG: hypothetical protein WCI61_02405 [Chloroflexota bacterium]
MTILSIALVVGAVVGAFVVGGAIDRDFPAEVALVRGALAFMAVAFVGYLGELVVVTAPKRDRAAEKKPAPAEHPEDAGALETKTEPQARPAPPRLMAPAPATDEDSNEDDADVDLRPAA